LCLSIANLYIIFDLQILKYRRILFARNYIDIEDKEIFNKYY